MAIYWGSSDLLCLAQVATVLAPAARLAFLVVTMLFIPCMATVAVIRQETNSWGWVLVMFGYMVTLAYLASFIVYHTAVALGGG